MALIEMTKHSDALGSQTRVRVVMPETGSIKDASVLWLLHGASDDGSGWLRYTNAELYAHEKGIVLIIPQCVNSYYADMAYGTNYFTYITKELPDECARLFGINTARENNFIAGLSMGGYGALKYALTYPQKFAGCAAFSAAIRPEKLVVSNQWPLSPKAGEAIFGHDIKNGIIPPEDDLFALAKSAAKQQTPDIKLFCGEQDALYCVNCEFADYLTSLGIKNSFTHSEGTHAWRYWDACLDETINMFFAK